MPVFLKIAPDLDDRALAEIVEAALAGGVAGIVATNTTLARDGLRSRHARRGRRPLRRAAVRRASTVVLAKVHVMTEGRLPLIGVGGVGSAEDAYAKIRAGASALQLYTALVYQGLGLVPRILAGLDALLARDGFASVARGGRHRPRRMAGGGLIRSPADRLGPSLRRLRPRIAKAGRQWRAARSGRPERQRGGRGAGRHPGQCQSGRGRPGGRGIAAAPGRAAAAGFVDGQIRQEPFCRRPARDLPEAITRQRMI